MCKICSFVAHRRKKKKTQCKSNKSTRVTVTTVSEKKIETHYPIYLPTSAWRLEREFLSPPCKGVKLFLNQTSCWSFEFGARTYLPTCSASSSFGNGPEIFLPTSFSPMNTSKFPRNRTEDSAPRKNLGKAEKKQTNEKRCPRKGKKRRSNTCPKNRCIYQNWLIPQNL